MTETFLPGTRGGGSYSCEIRCISCFNISLRFRKKGDKKPHSINFQAIHLSRQYLKAACVLTHLLNLAVIIFQSSSAYRLTFRNFHKLTSLLCFLGIIKVNLPQKVLMQPFLMVSVSICMSVTVLQELTS